MAFGVNLSGFVKKTLSDVQSSVQDRLKIAIGPLLDFQSGSSGISQLVGILSAEIAAIWDALQAIDRQYDPTDSEGAALDTVCALVGVKRNLARPTVVIAQCALEPGFTATAGAMVARVAGDENRQFKNSFAVAVPGSGGAAISVDVQFESLVNGPIPCPATYLTFRVTANPGWVGVNNAADGILGDLIETDSDLRLRREQELARPGSASVPALHAALSRLAGVTAVYVPNNDTDTVSVDGIAPHSFEAIVEGGNTLEIAKAIFAEKGAGDGMNGGTIQNVTAPDGLVRQIRFTRPTEVSIYLTVHMFVSSDFGTDDAFKQALVDWADDYFRPDTDVVPSRVSAQCFSVQGVVNVVHAYIGVAPAPALENVIAITMRQRARFATTRISVVRL